MPFNETLTMNPTSPYHTWRKVKNLSMSVLSFGCAVVVIAPLALVLFYLIKAGASASLRVRCADRAIGGIRTLQPRKNRGLQT